MNSLLSGGRIDEDFVGLLYYLSKDSMLIELYEVLGAESLTRLVAVFRETTLKIPSRQQLELAVRDYRVYRSMYDREEGVVRITPESKALAIELDISDAYTVQIAHKVRETVERLESQEIVHRLRRRLLLEEL